MAVYSLKDSKLDSTTVNILHVWAYSWMTAVCTGLGAVPFFMIDNVNDFWLGICNALAGGMMIAASFVLVYEGAAEGFDEQADEAVPFYVTIIKLLIGFLLGVGFIDVMLGIFISTGHSKSEHQMFQHSATISTTCQGIMFERLFIVES